MDLTEEDYQLVTVLAPGLPFVSRPYAAIGEQIGMDESEVIGRIEKMIEAGVIKRHGLVVRHHELGYRSNAMCVWNIPDERLDEIGKRFSAYDFVTLCYQRPRRLPDWPYSLFCMIHGKEREAVLKQVEVLAEECGLLDVERAVLFSGRRFKQRGARYAMKEAQ